MSPGSSATGARPRRGRRSSTASCAGSPAETRPRSCSTPSSGRGHALAELADGALVFRGFIDFVDAMPGDAEYDLAAIAFFVTRGDGLALGAFLDGYGWEGPRGAALALRLMRYLLLHRFAPLRWLLERRPPGDARTLEALAHRWMGLAE